jgi:hypothetical protein
MQLLLTLWQKTYSLGPGSFSDKSFMPTNFISNLVGYQIAKASKDIGTENA